MKRVISMLVAVILMLGLAPIGAFAAGTADMPVDSGMGSVVYDADGDPVSNFTISDGHVTADPVRPGTKFYVPLPSASSLITAPGGTTFPASNLYDSDDFTFKLKRDNNGKYVDTVKFVNRNLGNRGRANYIEVELKSSTIIEEVSVTFDVYFQARRSEASKWDSGDKIMTSFKLWVSNKTESGDTDLEAGDGIVFNPISNETNTITWGGNYDLASLEFNAASDAKKFFAKLSTKMDRDIAEQYGDPVDADLHFRTFVGNPQIDSTSKAILALYNPWDEDNGYDRDYGVDPRDCYLYQVDSDGYLEDITGSFTYVDGDDTPAGVSGWQIKTRVLGSYVISDVDLDVESSNSRLPIDRPGTVNPPSIAPGTPIPSPPTGSHDFLALSVALLAVSGAAIYFSRKRR